MDEGIAPEVRPATAGLLEEAGAADRGGQEYDDEDYRELEQHPLYPPAGPVRALRGAKEPSALSAHLKQHDGDEQDRGDYLDDVYNALHISGTIRQAGPARHWLGPAATPHHIP